MISNQVASLSFESAKERWTSEGTYPYSEEPTDPVARAVREVFDACAIGIHQKLPEFGTIDVGCRKLAMRLLRQAVETNPSNLQVILRDVFDLTTEQHQNLVLLLAKTKLSSIIQASKVVADRLTFIGSLEQLVFEPGFKKNLLERSQLHRILVDEMWVFGDQYILGTDDQSLKAALEEHLKLMGRTVLDENMTSTNGDSSIPDLMLYRRYADRVRGQYEHLVVEIKRPA